MVFIIASWDDWDRQDLKYLWKNFGHSERYMSKLESNRSESKCVFEEILFPTKLCNPGKYKTKWNNLLPPIKDHFACLISKTLHLVQQEEGWGSGPVPKEDIPPQPFSDITRRMVGDGQKYSYHKTISKPSQGTALPCESAGSYNGVSNFCVPSILLCSD